MLPLEFSEPVVTGELARAYLDATPDDDLAARMEMELGPQTGPPPAFAYLQVRLHGAVLGQLHKIRWVWGDEQYRFVSSSGKTCLVSSCKHALLAELEAVLNLRSLSEHP